MDKSLMHYSLFALSWKAKKGLEVLKESVDFYLNESNNMIPHSALRGATPYEVITQSWSDDKIKATPVYSAIEFDLKKIRRQKILDGIITEFDMAA